MYLHISHYKSCQSDFKGGWPILSEAIFMMSQASSFVSWHGFGLRAYSYTYYNDWMDRLHFLLVIFTTAPCVAPSSQQRPTTLLTPTHGRSIWLQVVLPGTRFLCCFFCPQNLKSWLGGGGGGLGVTTKTRDGRTVQLPRIIHACLSARHFPPLTMYQGK